MVGKFTAAALVLVLAGGGAAAQSEQKFGLRPDAKFLHPLPPLPPGSASPIADPRNLAGVWYSAVGMADTPDGPGSANSPSALASAPPYSDAAKAYRQRFREMEQRGTPLGGPEALCRPAINVRGSYIPGMIVQSSDEVLILGEPRRTAWHIHLNREHPKVVKPSFWGDSVGHWEGDTLVVDTIGFNGREALVSTQQHLVTRIRKMDGGSKLEMKFQVIDPVNLTRPFERTSVLVWRPDHEVLEDQCEENPEGAREGLTFEK